jgi:hypothetical protein
MLALRRSALTLDNIFFLGVSGKCVSSFNVFVSFRKEMANAHGKPEMTFMKCLDVGKFNSLLSSEMAELLWTSSSLGTALWSVIALSLGSSALSESVSGINLH